MRSPYLLVYLCSFTVFGTSVTLVGSDQTTSDITNPMYSAHLNVFPPLSSTSKRVSLRRILADGAAADDPLSELSNLVKKDTSECDREYYKDFIENEEFTFKIQKQECQKRIQEKLVLSNFGPPRNWQIRPEICVGICKEWDEKMRGALTQSSCNCTVAHPFNTDWACHETRATVLCDMLGDCMGDEEMDKMCKGHTSTLSAVLLLGITIVSANLYYILQ